MMNNKRRKEISKIVSTLEDVRDRLNEVVDEEQSAFDNMPESIQGSDRGCDSEEAIGYLSDALDSVQSALEYLDEF